MGNIKSRNMNYVYNVEYFENIKLISDKDKIKFSLGFDGDLGDFNFTDSRPVYALENMCSIKLGTLYPGLLIGTGYVHELSSEDAAKSGFSFDYVTGLPYIPGSSLKGMLRSYFPSGNEKDASKYAMIRAFLGKNLTDGQIDALKENIFENNDVFLDVYPVFEGNKRLLENEYITPHIKTIKSPKPIQLIKVRPGVVFEFPFVLSDADVEDVHISAAEKLGLFTQLLIYMGIGAKTNVGFGKLCEVKDLPKQKPEGVRRESKPADNNRKDIPFNNSKGQQGKCKICGKKTEIEKKTNKPHAYCKECFLKQNQKR